MSQDPAQLVAQAEAELADAKAKLELAQAETPAAPPAPKAPNPNCPVCHGSGQQVERLSALATRTTACPMCFPS